jgi:hypothetical protein
MHRSWIEGNGSRWTWSQGRIDTRKKYWLAENQQKRTGFPAERQSFNIFVISELLLASSPPRGELPRIGEGCQHLSNFSLTVHSTQRVTSREPARPGPEQEPARHPSRQRRLRRRGNRRCSHCSDDGRGSGPDRGNGRGHGSDHDRGSACRRTSRCQLPSPRSNRQHGSDGACGHGIRHSPSSHCNRRGRTGRLRHSAHHPPGRFQPGRKKSPHQKQRYGSFSNPPMCFQVPEGETTHVAVNRASSNRRRPSRVDAKSGTPCEVIPGR